MTTYECIHCGARFDSGDDRLPHGGHTCPTCGGPLRDIRRPME